MDREDNMWCIERKKWGTLYVSGDRLRDTEVSEINSGFLEQ